MGRALRLRKKTTLNLEASVLRSLRQEAVCRRCTMSELVEAALRLLLAPRERPARLPPLPSFRSGGTLVDVADRDALYAVIEGR